ncbi:MAG: hypothetical protein OXH71_02080, partial [Candidatus Dadabacteria bacterium]|nr:hypothetical protein [Candidatus Dadabacteria bacterium]
YEPSRLGRESIYTKTAFLEKRGREFRSISGDNGTMLRLADLPRNAFLLGLFISLQGFTCIEQKINKILINHLYIKSWDTISKSRNQLEVKAHACKKH